ncbi:hypothetical protein MMC20_007799 [Loxospora ochrophaea]|nr:hypothetical protein [Loxospora ochrophaea]
MNTIKSERSSLSTPLSGQVAPFAGNYTHGFPFPHDNMMQIQEVTSASDDHHPAIPQMYRVGSTDANPPGRIVPIYSGTPMMHQYSTDHDIGGTPTNQVANHSLQDSPSSMSNTSTLHESPHSQEIFYDQLPPQTYQLQPSQMAQHPQMQYPQYHHSLPNYSCHPGLPHQRVPQHQQHFNNPAVVRTSQPEQQHGENPNGWYDEIPYQAPMLVNETHQVGMPQLYDPGNESEWYLKDDNGIILPTQRITQNQWH